MGTRNLTVVISEGKHRIAQYAQWDGYPNGQGETVRHFCRKNLLTAEGRAKFKAKLRQVRFIDEAETRSLWDKVRPGAGASEFVSVDVASKFESIHPELSRNTGARILDIVWKSNDEVLARDSYEFAADSLMCEWAYVVDLDKQTFEAYKGFNKRPLGKKQRFYHLTSLRDNEYHPVRRVKEFRLSDVPATTDEFLSHFKRDW